MTNDQPSQDELRAMFGIDTATTVADADEKVAVRDVDQEIKEWAEKPETAFAVDEYNEMKGRDLAADENYQGLWDVEVETTDDQGNPVNAEVSLEPDPGMLADAFHAAFEVEPKLNLTSKDEQRRDFFSQLIDTPEFQSLHKRTALDATTSELAALSFASQVCEIRATVEANGDVTHPDPDREQFLKDMRNAGAAQAAAEAANDTITQYQDACNALAPGHEQGGNGGVDAKTLAKLFQEIKDSDVLKRICELAGKYLAVAQAAQRRKVNHGMDDIVGVELSGNIARAVPSELAQLADPALEDLVLKRILDSQLMSRRHEGVEKVAKGPVMFFCDESGSMGGEKIYHAKGLMLSMGWVAQKQKRWFSMNAFSSYRRSGNATDIGDEVTNQMRSIVIPPGKSNAGAMMEWLLQFQCGGTDIEWLHGSTMDYIYAMTKADVGATDVVILTDGHVRVSDEVIESCKAWKARTQTTIHVIVIPPGDEFSIKGLADRVFVLDKLSFDQGAVEDVLSI